MPSRSHQSLQNVYLAIATAFALTIGCNQVLGIEEAHLDDEFSSPSGIHDTGTSDAGGAGNSGTTGSGGTLDAGQDAMPGTGANTAVDANVGGSDNQADAGTSDVDTEPPLCERYCAAVAMYCKDDYAQYTDLQTCLDVCELFPSGEEDDAKVNTVHCRLRQANLARLEPFTHCPMAGPGGHGECGTNCEGFCDIMMAVCTEETADHYYASRADCLQDCSSLPDLGTYTVATPAAQFVGGHVQCRLFHASAASQEASYHCEHALGGEPCVPAEPDGGEESGKESRVRSCFP